MGSNQRRKKQLLRQSLVLFSIIVTLFLIYQLVYYNIQSEKLACGTFTKDESRSPRFCMEIARTMGEKSKGLMYRKPGEMQEDQGMIFVYPEEGSNSFWMKNTYIPLDMVFLDSKMEVVGIVRNAEPLTLTPRSVNAKSQYVVEILAGLSEKWGIDKGWKLVIDKKL